MATAVGGCRGGATWSRSPGAHGFVTNAATFALAAWIVLPLRAPRHNAPARRVRELAREVVEGVRYLAGQKILVFLTGVYLISWSYVGAWWPIGTIGFLYTQLAPSTFITSPLT